MKASYWLARPRVFLTIMRKAQKTFSLPFYPSGIQTAEPDINIESSSPEPYPETTDVPSEGAGKRCDDFIVPG